MIRNGGVLELTMEDIGKTDGKLIRGELLDGSDGRILQVHCPEWGEIIRVQEWGCKNIASFLFIAKIKKMYCIFI